LQYNVEWDPEKARINFQKHGISFELASSVFFDPRAVTIFDHEHGESEDRWITLGIAKNGQLVVMCHLFKEETKESCTIRIFSARKATKFEIKSYKGL
jgi:Uncharacterized protein conserved in bacteria